MPDWVKIDDKTAMFLVIAVVALVVERISKLKGFGIEFEQKVAELNNSVKSVEAAVGDLEKSVGPGSKAAIGQGSAAAQAQAIAAAPAAVALDIDDPNKGRFGGMAESNGRKITAIIEPDGGRKSSRCRVKIKITSTNSERLLTGKVKIYLHPTFGAGAIYDLDVKGGVATDEIVSYGAFTIGAEADKGETKLELDLVDVPGGTDRFYQL